MVAPSGAAQDPTVSGASLRLRNPGSGEQVVIALPASNWVGLGKPAGSKGYKYKDSSRSLGPCKVALLKPGKVIKAVCRGEIAFTLDEPQQGTLDIRLSSGTGGGALSFCTEFGGTVTEDRPAVGAKPGLFKATGATAPASCVP